MNIYQRKQKWKLWLLIAAGLIVGASLWYTSMLVDSMAAEEREKARLWAEAVRKKASLVKITDDLFQKVAAEERKRMELWAKATEKLTVADSDFDFYLQVVQSNTSIPVILANEQLEITSFLNLDSISNNETLGSLSVAQRAYLQRELNEMKENFSPIPIPYFENRKNYLFYKDSKLFADLKVVMEDLISSFISDVVVNNATVPVIYTRADKKTVIAFGNIDSTLISKPGRAQELIAEMEAENTPIEIELTGEQASYLFYQNSFLLTQLRFFPLVQFSIIGLFLLIAYILFSTSRKAEQNQVWVGMAKETAHQLGTPLSSLMAWLELMKERNMDKVMTDEIEKDINRLNTITERFSKIGATPALEPADIRLVLDNSMAYLGKRISSQVKHTVESPSTLVLLNVPLFEWVIENLVKNAVDAMEGRGELKLTVTDMFQHVYIDISDTGKGVPKNKYRTVFQPGYTTRKRGWGLGLSLAKRIIENYHNGKIFIKRSEPGKGTTFRIVLNKV